MTSVVIRVDASVSIGGGHMMRCLSLAEALRGRGADVDFVCRLFPGHLTDLAKERGFFVHTLAPHGAEARDHVSWLRENWERDATETAQAIAGRDVPSWIVVDHYALTRSWEAHARGRAQRLMVIDDLASDCHDCDLILNQSLFTVAALRYEGKVPAECRRLVGPKYALLRTEFAELRGSHTRAYNDELRILVFMGTGDPEGVTLRVATLLRNMAKHDWQVDIVVGSSNLQGDEIRSLCEQTRHFHYHCQTPHMAELMAHADLAVTGGGTSSWERCCLGLPAAVLAIAENQVESSTELADAGACIFLGRSGSVTDNQLAECIETLATSPAMRKAISAAAFDLVDGRGCERVAAEMGAL